MEISTNIIEAILFAAGNAVPTDLLRDKLNLTKAQMDSWYASWKRSIPETAVFACLFSIIKYNLPPTPIIRNR